MRGNCYVASEALYHLLGGKDSGWKPMHMKVDGESHWFLKHENGTILDATNAQFAFPPQYENARGKGFLTRTPSERARRLMEEILWQA